MVTCYSVISVLSILQTQDKGLLSIEKKLQKE